MDKNSIIENGIYSEFLKEKQKLFINGSESTDKKNYLHIFDIETIDLCFKIFNSTRARKKYGLDQLIKWCYVVETTSCFKGWKLVFGTLTFNDETFKATSKETRRRYVARFLKDNTENYIANIDFGKTTNREHYHFVALCSHDIEKNSWKYGFDSYREIKHTMDDIQKAKKYLIKLNNHSYKDSTRNERVIMNKSKTKIDLIDVIVEANDIDFKKFKLRFYES